MDKTDYIVLFVATDEILWKNGRRNNFFLGYRFCIVLSAMAKRGMPRKSKIKNQRWYMVVRFLSCWWRRQHGRSGVLAQQECRRQRIKSDFRGSVLFLHNSRKAIYAAPYIRKRWRQSQMDYSWLKKFVATENFHSTFLCVHSGIFDSSWSWKFRGLCKQWKCCSKFVCCQYMIFCE